MKIHEKLKGIPKIYYINLEHRKDRREFIESQFYNWGITNYTRVNASRYLKDDYDAWKDILHLNQFIVGDMRRPIAVSLSHLEILKEWLETTDEDYVILMEDDTDISTIEYWHFDWEYLMNNIPYDWDAIQLMYNSANRIYCFLHPKKMITWNGPMLISRSYAEKLLSLYYVKGKYNFIKRVNRVYKVDNINNFNGRYSALDVDEFLGFNGKVYQIPVFTQNPYLDEPPKPHHILSRKIHLLWWTKVKNEFTLEDFFTYGKDYDSKMMFGIGCYG
jgi:hypothetical protein